MSFRAPAWARRLHRTISWHRRLVSALLAAGAVAMSVAALRPDPPETIAVLVADRDLRGGARVAAGDLRTAHLPPPAVPVGALRPGDRAEGRTLASPVRHGEPLTDVRFVGPALIDGYAETGQDLVATPVRIADAEAVRLLHPGDRVDVLAADARTPESGGTATARVVATTVRVIAVPATARGDPAAAASDGALIVLATDPDVATRLASAAITARLSVTLRTAD